MKNRSTSVVVLSAIGLLVYANVSAQTSSEVLEEIVVTANKRQQSLLDLGGSITALDSAAIEDRSITSVADLHGVVPNVLFRDFLSSVMINIRGIGTGIDTGIVEPGVAVHMDGVYLARGDMLVMDMNDIERIEVLRGPQGTLYGKNATGGVVNFIPKSPSEEFEGKASVGFGSYEKVKGSLVLSGPLTDSVRGRLSAFWEDSDGYHENLWNDEEFGGSEKRGIRGTLDIDLDEDWMMRVVAHYQDIDGSGNSAQNHDLSQQTWAQGLEANFGGMVLNTDEPHKILEAFEPQTELDTVGGNIQFFGNIGNVDVRSITAYVDHRMGPWIHPYGGVYVGGALSVPGAPVVTGIILGREDAPRIQTSKMFTQEFNFSGVAFNEKLDWLVGFYYFNEDYWASIPVGFTDPNVSANLGNLDVIDGYLNEDNQSISGFFDVTYHMTDDMRFNVGGRLFDEQKHTTQERVITFKGGFQFTVCENLEVDFNETEFEPKVRFEWDPAADMLAYAQWQKGSKSGQVNHSGCGNNVPQETIDSYELGLKGALADGRFQFAAAAYFYDYENHQTRAVDPTVSAGSIFLSTPKSEAYGLEFESRLLLFENTTANFALTWMDSEITEGNYADPANLAAGPVDLVGNRMPATPKWTGTLGVEHTATIADGMSLTSRAEVIYVDDQSFRQFGRIHPSDGEDAVTTLNLYSTLEFADGKYQIRAYVKNATDETYRTWAFFSPTGFTGTLAAPRNWGVDLTAHF